MMVDERLKVPHGACFVLFLSVAGCLELDWNLEGSMHLHRAEAAESARVIVVAHTNVGCVDEL